MYYYISSAKSGLIRTINTFLNTLIIQTIKTNYNKEY